MHDSNDGGHDDHEPGDVNGNVDPAFAKAQRQPRAPRQAGQARPEGQARQARQPRDPNQPPQARPARPARPPRQPRAAADAAALATEPSAVTTPDQPDGSLQNVEVQAPRPARAPRPPREPRAARPPRAASQSRSENTSSEPPAQITNWLDADSAAPRDASASPSVDGAIANTNTNTTGLNGEQQDRTRGPRRNRRGGRGRNGRSGDLREGQGQGTRDANQNGAASDGAFVPNDPAFATDGVALADGEYRPYAAPHSNPGAFGDPGRPMDRAGRRNRNQRDRRELAHPVRIGQRAAAEYAPRFDSEGLPVSGQPVSDQPAISGVNDAGERDGERLHKVLAQQGLGSRRSMEAMIAAGEVQVNGAKARVGQVVNEHDRVHVNRRKVTVKLGDDNPRILIYHKQSGEIVSRDDPEQRDTVFDRLPKPDHGKWVSVGRLDYNSEGLMLFTTYGELANRFMHPRFEILREYSVRVLGELTPEQEDQLMDGIELDDGPARVLSLDRIDRDSDAANHWYKITLNEGRNREVRRMFEHLGLTVSRLIRVSYGCVQMPSWLKRGQSKLLDEAETFEVLESVGLRSKKKLEKAARFGGRNRIPQQPLGPMRSAAEHEAVWTGLPADAGATQGRGRRQPGGRGVPGQGGPGANGRQGGRFNSGNGGGRGGNSSSAPVALQQQQFPGFGGATEMPAIGRRQQRTPGNRVKRDGNGEVNGNVAPGYRGAAGGGNAGNGANGGGRNNRRSAGGGNANAGNGGNGANGGGGAGNGATRGGRQRRTGGRGPNTGAGGGSRNEGVAAGAATMPDTE
ncbi:MAG: rRNA pseudouridine synthase [Rhizobacter sp.]|nr:rRNA pseudouridine synthase [Burkholderiales bacterium]